MAWLLAFGSMVIASAEAPGSETVPARPETHGEAGIQAPDSAETAQALRIQGDPGAGSRTYETCAVCHGPEGAGRADGTFPAIAGQHEAVIIKQLVDMREGRRRNPVMDVHARDLMDARELADVAAYIATLPAPRRNGQGAGDALDEGRQLYLRDCSGCHGQSGGGDAASFIPSLVGQHYGYLLRQVRAIAGGRRRDAHPRMAETVASYRDADLRAVVDYISRLESVGASEGARP
jgi:cytochrome c553